MIWKYTVISVLLFATCLMWQCSSENIWDVRLLNGGHLYEGRVEIYLGSKGWFGTCDKEWGIEEAIVVCRQLRYPGAIKAIPGFSPSYTVLLSRDWRCTGDEATISGCNNYRPTLPCYEYAGIICHGPGYLGCYQDTYGALTSALIDNMIVEPDMTVDRCRQFCMYRHYRIVGLKNGNECYCGLSESELANRTKLSDAQCQFPCPGNDRQVCGGYRTDTDKISVFDVNMGECADPGVPDNGVQLDSSFKFGDIVRYACLPGYEIVGVQAVQCILAPGGPGMGVIWSTSIPSCSLIPLTSRPTPAQEPTTTPMMMTTPRTTMREKTTTMKTATTAEPMQTTTLMTTKKTTTRDTMTTESSKMMLTEERTTTAEMSKPAETTSQAMTPSEAPSSSTPETMTKEMTPKKRSTVEMMSEATKRTTTMTVEEVNDVTNYTHYITKPTTSEEPGNNTSNNQAQQKPFNFFAMLSEHSILIALGGTFLILLIPIIIIVVFKKACRRKKSPGKVQIERSMDYQMGSETSGFTYEPQPHARPRYQSFRRGFKRFSKRPWSDREEESSDEEL